MKKKLLIGLAAVVILVGAIIFYLASNANTLIAKYKPDMERLASDAMGNKVTLDGLSVSIFPSTQIKIAEVSVGETAKGKADFALQNLLLQIRLLPLLGGNLEITKLLLDKPEIRFKKDARGVRIDGLPDRPKAEVPSSNPPATKAEASKPGGLPAGLKLELEALEINEANLIFEDSLAKKTYTLSDLNVKAALIIAGNLVKIPEANVSAKALKSIPVSLSAADIGLDLASGQLDLTQATLTLPLGSLTSQGKVNIGTLRGDVALDSSGLDLSKLPIFAEIVPQLKEIALSGSLHPQAKVQLEGSSRFNLTSDINLKNVGLVKGDLKVSALSGSLKTSASPEVKRLENLAVNLNLGQEPIQVQAQAILDHESLRITPLKIQAFSGTINNSFSWKQPSDQSFANQLSVENVRLEQAAKAFKPELPTFITGTLQQFSANINGTLNDQLKASLVGSGSLNVKDGSLVGLNLAGSVLKALKNIPMISGAIYDSVPADERASIDSPDTKIESITGTFQIESQVLSTKDLKLQSNIFALEAKGRVGFDSKLDLDATIFFNPAFSSSLATKTKEIASFLDSQGRLVVPLSISGVPPKVVVLPDIPKFIKGAGKQVVGQALDRLLGGDKSNPGEKKKGLGGLLGF